MLHPHLVVYSARGDVWLVQASALVVSNEVKLPQNLVPGAALPRTALFDASANRADPDLREAFHPDALIPVHANDLDGRAGSQGFGHARVGASGGPALHLMDEPPADQTVLHIDRDWILPFRGLPDASLEVTGLLGEESVEDL